MEKLGDFLNSINFTKEKFPDDETISSETEKQYGKLSFVVNRSLSYHEDTIMLVNEINVHHHIDPKLKFDFLLNTVRKRKRFAKWHKVPKVDDIALVKEYYGYSNTKAIEVLELLTEEQIDVLKQKMYKGE